MSRTAQLVRILDPEGKVIGDPPLSAERSVELYRHMALVRLLDRKMVNLQRQGRIAFYGPILGQEAATMASGYALEPTDWVFPALREAGIALLRGLPLEKYVAQLMGNASDDGMGRQMPCHFTLPGGAFVSMSSCIATQLPHAVGAAMAARICKDRVAVAAFLGDGATSEQDFHVAMNFAGVFRAPVVFICQNNHWAISVPVEKQTASATIAVKARAYGFPGVRVDGNDALAVYRSVKEAADRAREGEGPTLLELVTYRMLGHTTSDDPRTYRDENLVEPWKRRDPIERMRRFLDSRRWWNDAAQEAFERDTGERIERAVRANEGLGPPPVESMFEDVYAAIPDHLAEQRSGLV